jgi:hypothetical protein
MRSRGCSHLRGAFTASIRRTVKTTVTEFHLVPYLGHFNILFRKETLFIKFEVHFVKQGLWKIGKIHNYIRQIVQKILHLY